MAKSIELDYKGKTYVLEYTRDTIRQMEKEGFNIKEASDGSAPVTMILGLFEGAFKKNHPTVNPQLIDNMYEDISEKDTLLEALVEMYTEPVEALMSDPDEVRAKNAKWKKKW